MGGAQNSGNRGRQKLTIKESLAKIEMRSCIVKGK